MYSNVSDFRGVVGDEYCVMLMCVYCCEFNEFQVFILLQNFLFIINFYLWVVGFYFCLVGFFDFSKIFVYLDDLMVFWWVIISYFDYILEGDL